MPSLLHPALLSGYAPLTADYHERGRGRFDEGDIPLRHSDRIEHVETRVQTANIGPTWPGWDLPDLVGPFELTQIALLRRDGSPHSYHDLPERIVVAEGQTLFELTMSIRIVLA